MGTRHIQLSEGEPRRVRLLAGIASLPSADKRSSWVTITRTGTFTDPRYGQFSITEPMLLAMVGNFDSHTLGVDVFIDVNHQPGDGAAAKILKLTVEGQRLRALVEWNDYGINAVRSRGYQYLSADYSENYVDNEQGCEHGPVLLGAGLTVRPVIKHLDPITLSCAADGPPILIHPSLVSELQTEAHHAMQKHLAELRRRLEQKKLSEAAIKIILKTAEQSFKLAGDDDATSQRVLAEFDTQAVTLAEEIAAAGTPPAANPPTNTPPANTTPRQLSESDVAAIVQRTLDAAQTSARQLAETQTARRSLLCESINAATGIDEALRRELAETVQDLVTGESSEEFVRALAATQIASGNRVMAARQLSAMGYHPSGTPRVTVPDESSRQLSEIYREHLARTDVAGQLHLDPKATLPPFVQRVLSEFDRMHARAIADERRMLAEGGESTMSNVELPVGFQREVIREALHDLNVLQLVQTLTDFAATETTMIPYEERDGTAHLGDGIVYEGQEIPFASVSQRMDAAYITPMKIAISITNEVAHFTRASAINWDAMARNLESAARVLRELIARRICNELQRAADAYMAQPVAGEALEAAHLAAGVLSLANFPLVRPAQAFNVQGVAAGLPQNPITLVLDGNPVIPWDGTGLQPVGLYYRVLSYNMAQIQIVNERGEPRPGTAAAGTVDYSYATNVMRVNIDVPAGSSLEVELNRVIQAFGAQKAMLATQRYIKPDFALMSPTLNDAITNAEQFIAERKRDGSDTSGQGDLATIKGVGTFGTNAPGIDLGDERILIGQRGLLGYTVAKPFAFGAPFELTRNGHPIGKRAAYGEEYNALKVPNAVANRMTSILVYNASSRG